jgi:mediator of RNA polymerase II transcription subunit 31
MNTTKTINYDTKAQEEIYRFIQDLEFVQCLSNPLYLEFLAQNNYFNDQRFINYLEYLQYFKNIEYMKYITYSRSIVFLDLIQYDFFRELLYDEKFINYLLNIILEDSFPQIKNQNENNITNKMENMTINK